MSTELSTSDLSTQMEFARLVTTQPERGGSSILPENYRGNPANVLIAVGLGSAMGLSPAESLYRISVIKGKPSAAAELIAANVRKAGHKLRVRVTEEPPAAMCTIVRADDPDEPTTVTRDMAWAQRMGLAGEPNYRKQPATMLSYRAITACARLACPEALYGVTYTPDEAASLDEAPAAPAVSLADFGKKPAADPVSDVIDAEEVPDETPKLNARQKGKLFALFNQKGIPEDQQRPGIEHIIGRKIQHRDELSLAEFEQVLAQLEARPDAESSPEPLPVGE